MYGNEVYLLRRRRREARIVNETVRPPKGKQFFYHNDDNFSPFRCSLVDFPRLQVPAVNETWLKRCDHGQFFTTEPIGDETIPFTTVFSGLNDSYHQLFYKTMRGFHYSYVHVSKDFDWYMKVEKIVDWISFFRQTMIPTSLWNI